MKGSPTAPLLLLLAITGCGSARTATPRASLPPDSVALLAEALQRARPAYPTQTEALRSGIYASREPAVGPVLGTPGPRQEPPAPSSISRPPAEGLPEAPARPHRFGVQIAAFRDQASAALAAADAHRHFPDLVAIVEPGDGWFRVALAGWPDESGAQAALGSIRLLYSGAWVRSLPVP